MESAVGGIENISFASNAGLFPNTPDLDTSTFTLPTALQMTDYLEYRISVGLVKYVSPIILIVGTFGNVMSFAVLRTRAFRGCPVAFTLSALAIVDTSVLYTSLLRQWLLSLTDKELDVRVVFWSVGCKVHMLLTYYLQQLSSWTLVVLTVERSCCVCLPLLAKTFCTRFKVRLLWAAIVLLLLFINAHFLWTAEYALQPRNEWVNETSLICYIGPRFHAFFYDVWYWLDFTLVSVLPFIFILTGNIVIIASIVRGAKFRLELHQHPVSSSAAAATTSKAIPRYSTMTSSTAMLIGVSAMFFLTTTPSTVYFLLADQFLSNPSAQCEARVQLAFAATNLLYYTNNAVNFLLYCLTGTRFRRALVSVFQKRSNEAAELRTRDLKSNTMDSTPMAKSKLYTAVEKRS